MALRMGARSLAVAVLCCLALSGAHARKLLGTTAVNTTFLVFFGDSATANGGKGINFVAPYLDPVTGYATGRWSNGPVWPDFLNQQWSKKTKTTWKNYAVGGATACNVNSLFTNNPPLDKQTAQFQTDVKNGVLPAANNTVNDRVIFFQMIGGNDVGVALSNNLFHTSTFFTNTAKSTVACEMANVDAIIAAGYKEIVLLPTPPVNQCPMTSSLMDPDTQRLIDAINDEMATQVAARQAQYAAAPVGSLQYGVKLYQMEGVGLGVPTMPIQDRACWDLPPYVGVVTYDNAGLYKKCTNPTDYAYFDNVHPTTVYHSWFTTNPDTGVWPMVQQMGLVH